MFTLKVHSVVQVDPVTDLDQCPDETIGVTPYVASVRVGRLPFLDSLVS